MIAIKALPARNGDAFLITTDDATQRGAVLVDGGYASTFDQSIRPELEALAKRGYCLDLVVATHVDADHIAGLIAFFQANGNASTPDVIGVKDVWHNSLRGLTGHAANVTVNNRADEEILAGIRSRGFPIPPNAGPNEISVRQGSSLAALLLRRGYRWNGGDGTRTIEGDGRPTTTIAPDLRVTVIGPTAARLDALRQWWTAAMRRLGYVGPVGTDERFDDAFEFAVAHGDYAASRRPAKISHSCNGARSLADVHVPDDSIANGSSISLILEHQSRSVLLLGDSWAADTVASLRALGSGGRPMLFDAIKVAHHGSMRNTNPELLDLVDAPRYLVCTNGERHGHPDIEVLKAIVDRPSVLARVLHFNYSTAVSHFMRTYKSASGTLFSVMEGSRDWIQLDGPVEL